MDDTVRASFAELLQQHREEDDKRFDALAMMLSRIDSNVISLMETRSFARGALKMVLWVSTAISTGIGLLIAWIKH